MGSTESTITTQPFEKLGAVFAMSTFSLVFYDWVCMCTDMYEINVFISRPLFLYHVI